MEYLTAEDADGVHILRLARPGDGNRLTPSLVREMAAALRQVRKSDGRVLLLMADGPDFSLGAGTVPEGDGDQNPARRTGTWLRGEADPLIVAVRDLHIPVVAALHGRVVGGGLALALAADVRVAADDIAVSVGAKPADAFGHGLPWLLLHQIGRARALSVLLGPDEFGAADVLRLGLADEVVDAGVLEQRCRNVAAVLVDRPSWFGPAVVRAVRAAEELGLPEASRYASYLVEEALAATR